MPEDSRKLYYSIGEVADIFHVNESLLRFWEKEFPTTIKPKKNAKGTRSYTKEDIESVRMIYFMVKEKGMTLAGAKKRLKEEKKGMTAQFELSERLKKIRVELLKLQDELGRSDDVEDPSIEACAEAPKRMFFASPGEE
jgi:DNA-binding transcriptional MerR regulator